jgi:hypothetical protein
VELDEIIDRLKKKRISSEDANNYATGLMDVKYNTLRKLATLTEPKLEKLEFAWGDQCVAIEAFQEWSQEFSSTATGTLHLIPP